MRGVLVLVRFRIYVMHRVDVGDEEGFLVKYEVAKFYGHEDKG